MALGGACQHQGAHQHRDVGERLVARRRLAAAAAHPEAPPQEMIALSSHLSRDVNRDEIDPEKHASWLARRVPGYGRWTDWQILVSEYGKPRLAELAIGLRSLPPKSAFRCPPRRRPAARGLGYGSTEWPDRDKFLFSRRACVT